MERRKLLIGGPLVVSFGVAEGAHGGMWRGKLGTVHVSQLHRYVDHLIIEDSRHGGNALFAQAATQFRMVQASLNAGEFDSRVEKKLYGAVGNLATAAGWLAFDSGLHREARYHYGEALVAARLAGDRGLTAKAYVSMSLQAAVVGWPSESLHLAKVGQDVAERLSSPAMLSLLVAREGEAHARMGAAKEAVECFARAEYLLDRADGVHKPTWLTFYDERELGTIKACAFMYLERYDNAESLFRAAVECDEAHLRNRASRITHLAAAQLSQANVSEAAHTAETALVALEGGVASTRLIDRLKGLREQFHDYRNVPAVGSFYDHYSAVMDGRRAHGSDLV